MAPATSFWLRPRPFTDLEWLSVSAATATATTVRGCWRVRWGRIWRVRGHRGRWSRHHGCCVSCVWEKREGFINIWKYLFCTPSFFYLLPMWEKLWNRDLSPLRADLLQVILLCPNIILVNYEISLLFYKISICFQLLVHGLAVEMTIVPINV